jgi:carbon starvation protein
VASAPALILGQRIDAVLALLFAVILWVVILDMLRMSTRFLNGKPVNPLSESPHTQTQLAWARD